jgi:osmotically-inducible protein OsmY
MSQTNCEDVAVRAQTAIANNSYFRGTSYPLHFSSYEKVVVVNGSVPSFYLKQLIQSTLGGLDGVERVVNQVTVDYRAFGS